MQKYLCEKRKATILGASLPHSETTFLPLKVKLLKLLFDPQDAIKNNSFWGKELKIEKGDLKKGFSEADNVVSGTAARAAVGLGQPWLVNEIQALYLGAGKGFPIISEQKSSSGVCNKIVDSWLGKNFCHSPLS